jgi:hypothetical protein
MQGCGGQLIKIGIEVSHDKLQYDLLMHPARYFFILVVDGLAYLCIRTCDTKGENIISHVVDGLMVDKDGNLVSIFADELEDAIFEMRNGKSSSWEGEEYPISAHLAWLISAVPGLIDWILSSIVKDGRNMVINSISDMDICH